MKIISQQKCKISQVCWKIDEKCDVIHLESSRFSPMTPIFCMFFGHLHLLQEPLPNEVNFTTLRATGLAWLRHRAPYRIHRSHQVHRKRLAIHRGQFIVSDSFSPLCQENRCTSKRGRFARFGTAASETKEDGQVKPFSGKRLQNTWDLMSPSSFLESYHDIMTS